jgi:pyruvyl transferase EpsO
VPLNPDAERVGALNRAIDDVLGPLVAGEAPLALVDFPNHRNAGDAAIWLGELAFLERAGRRPSYVCEVRSYSRRHLAGAIGDDGVILLSGGGNLGDLWPTFQFFRERVIGDFPANRIVQLPQTIFFRDPSALERAEAILGRHPRFTLLTRDPRSLAIARDRFSAASQLCPDMSFALGPLERASGPDVDVVVLARDCVESTGALRRVVLPGAPRGDWPSERASGLGYPILRKASKVAGRALGRQPLSGLILDALARVYRVLARERLDAAVRTLSRGRAVITDRLHGHVLCLLLGIPHVVLDNSYGKLSAFHRTWTADSELARWCEDAREAESLARELAEEVAIEQPGEARGY